MSRTILPIALCLLLYALPLRAQEMPAASDAPSAEKSGSLKFTFLTGFGVGNTLDFVNTKFPQVIEYGGRFGVSLPNQLYVGVNLFSGTIFPSTIDSPLPRTSTRTFILAAEFGYEMQWTNWLTGRLYGLLGGNYIERDVPLTRTWEVAASPGFMILANPGGGIFTVGLDTKLVLPSASLVFGFRF